MLNSVSNEREEQSNSATTPENRAAEQLQEIHQSFNAAAINELASETAKEELHEDQLPASEYSPLNKTMEPDRGSETSIRTEDKRPSNETERGSEESQSILSLTDAYDPVDLYTDTLPAVDTPDACDKAAAR